MQRLVIDTNCLMQIIPGSSRYHDVWLSLLEGCYALCVSSEILNEYEEILQRFTSPEFASYALEVIVNNPNTLLFTPFYKFHLIEADPDDNKFVDCAIAANARYLVTEDHHFDVLKKVDFPKVAIIGLDDFLKEIPKL